MKPNREQLEALLRCLSATSEREIHCGEFLDRAAAYAEALDHDPDRLDAEMSQHLTICPECQEEFEALRASLRD